MSTCPNIKINNEPELIGIKTKDDEIKDLKYKTEKHDFENIVKSLKIENDYYKKNYKSLNTRKIFMIVSEKLLGAGGLSVVSGLTISGIAPVGRVTAGSISFLSSISTLITDKNLSRLEIRYTKLRDCINETTLLYEKKHLKNLGLIKKIDEKEGEKIRSIYNHYFNKQNEIKKNLLNSKLKKSLVILFHKILIHPNR